MAIMKAYVIIGAKLGPLRKALAKMRKMVSRAIAALESAFKKMATTALRYSKYIAAAYIAMGVASTKFAMDAEESENLFDVSMGKMADSTRRWSEELSKALFLNTYAVRKTTGVFNVMLVSMGIGTEKARDMSQSLAKLAYDMASFYNIPNEEAFVKLQAGITGLVKPLKRIGIIVMEETIKEYAYATGLIKVGEQLTQKQKVLARYGVIMQQTTMAQGDLLRTISSTTNVLRTLRAVVKMLAIDYGNILLPAVTKVMLKMRAWLMENREGILKFGASLHHAIGAAAKVLTVFIQPMLDGLENLGRKFSSFATESKLEDAIWAVGEWVDRIWGRIKLLYTMITNLWKDDAIGDTIKQALINALAHIIRWGKQIWILFKGLGRSVAHEFAVAFAEEFAKFTARSLKTPSLYGSPLTKLAKIGMGGFALDMLKTAKADKPPGLGELLTQAAEVPEYPIPMPRKFINGINKFSEAAELFDKATREKWLQIRQEAKDARYIKEAIDFSGVRRPGAISGGGAAGGAAGGKFGFSSIRSSWANMVSSMQSDPTVVAVNETTRAIKDQTQNQKMREVNANAKRERMIAAMERVGTYGA